MLGKHGPVDCLGKKHSAVLLLYRLMRTDGNTGKLDAAKTLLRTVAAGICRQAGLRPGGQLVYEILLEHF